MRPIQKAVDILRAGGVIAFPTETVYGLAGDATSDRAVNKIYDLKGRDTEKPLSIQVPDLETLWQYVDKNDVAEALARHFWPGPLTMVCKCKRGTAISSFVNKGGATLGVRMPQHPVALTLLKAFGKPLAVPSANLSGKAPATTVAQVEKIFGDALDFYLDGGDSDVGTPSTVVDVSEGAVQVLRQGAIDLADIQKVLHQGPDPLTHQI